MRYLYQNAKCFFECLMSVNRAYKKEKSLFSKLMLRLDEARKCWNRNYDIIALIYFYFIFLTRRVRGSLLSIYIFPVSSWTAWPHPFFLKFWTHRMKDVLIYKDNHQLIRHEMFVGGWPYKNNYLLHSIKTCIRFWKTTSNAPFCISSLDHWVMLEY